MHNNPSLTYLLLLSFVALERQVSEFHFSHRVPLEKFHSLSLFPWNTWKIRRVIFISGVRAESTDGFAGRVPRDQTSVTFSIRRTVTQNKHVIINVKPSRTLPTRALGSGLILEQHRLEVGKGREPLSECGECRLGREHKYGGGFQRCLARWG